MKILSLDTSTKNFSLAVLDNEKPLAVENITLEKILSDSIVPAIEKILKKTKTKLKDIDGFVVGLGPGSFTSLRVGLSTVKAMSFSLNKPVVGISSLEAIALNFAKDHPQVAVLNDARRNLVYAGLYAKKNGELKKLRKESLSEFAPWLKELKGEVVFIGDAIKIFKSQIEAASIKPVFVNEKLWYPQADKLALLGLERLRQKKFDRIEKLVPTYLYAEDCQVHR